MIGRPGVAAAALWLCLVRGLAAQSIEVTADTGRVTVGDSVTARIRVRLDERDLLLSKLPRLPDTVDGVRLLHADSLVRGEYGVFTGRAVFAFYRPGTQQIPPLTFRYRRNILLLEAELVSDPVPVEVASVVTASTASYRDIKPLIMSPGPPAWPVALAAALLLAGTLALWRRHRRRRLTATGGSAAASSTAEAGLDPYERARRRLAALEAARQDPTVVAEHATAILRECLAAAEGVPALSRTTGELISALPPRLAPAEVRDILQVGDLVKFARARPGPGAADEVLRRSQAVLERWSRAEREHDAIR